MRELDCSAVLFDLDGVLVDSRAVIERRWRRWANSHKLEPDQILEIAHGRRTIDTIRLVAPHLDAVEEATRLVETEARDTEGLVAMDGAPALISALPAGAWAVVTSGIRITATTRLSHVELPLPAVLVSADDVRRGKLDPEGYLTAADRLSIAPSECVVIEDTPPGLAAAKAAGMQAIGLAFQYSPEQLSDADSVVGRLTDLGVEIAARGRPIVLRASV